MPFSNAEAALAVKAPLEAQRSIPDQKEAPESNQVGSRCPRLTWVIAFWLAVASNRRVCCWRKRSANWLAHDALELLGLEHVAEPLGNQLQAPQVKMPRVKEG